MQQTFKFNLDDIKTVTGEDDEILTTIVDEEVDGFYESLIMENKMPLMKQFLLSTTHLMCIVEYRIMSDEEKIKMQKIRAEQSGLIIPDLKLS